MSGVDVLHVVDLDDAFATAVEGVAIADVGNAVSVRVGVAHLETVGQPLGRGLDGDLRAAAVRGDERRSALRLLLQLLHVVRTVALEEDGMDVVDVHVDDAGGGLAGLVVGLVLVRKDGDEDGCEDHENADSSAIHVAPRKNRPLRPG